MTALIKGRETSERIGGIKGGLLAAAVNVFAGALLVRDADGNIAPGTTTVGVVGVGRAEEAIDNTNGLAGEKAIRFKPGTFRFANSAAADEITAADIGTACFVVDDQTVAKTSNANARSKAGVVDGVDSLGVWVRFDEALTRATS